MSQAPPSNPPPTEAIFRWVLFGALIMMGLWLGQALQTMLSQSVSSENPFADSITPLPPNRVVASVEIQDYFSQVADQPNGYTAFISLINAEAIYLQISRLQNDSANQTITQVCYDVVSIYEEISPSSEYPPPRYLAMELPLQRVLVAYDDAVAYMKGELNLGEFEGRWQVGG